MDMIRETVSTRTQGITLGIRDTNLASICTRDIEETAVRVFRDGQVGVASAVGAYELSALTARAEAGLALQVPHTPGACQGGTTATEHDGKEASTGELVSATERLLKGIRDAHPGFLVTDEIGMRVVTERLENDLGTAHSYRRTATRIQLVMQVKGSGSILDTMFYFDLPDLNPDAILAEIGPRLDAWAQVGTPEPGPTRVLFKGLDELFLPLQGAFNIRAVATGSSLFCKSALLAAVSEDVRLFEVRDPARRSVCPFDREGMVRSSPDRLVLERGAIHPVASRRDAALHGVEPTGNAVGELSSLPHTGLGHLELQGTVDDLPALLDGQGAVVVDLAMGGACSAAGEYALPVQVGYRVNAQGEVVERIPGFTLTGRFEEVFGDGFLGATRSTAPLSERTWMLTTMSLHA
jgi:PmbA protein